MRAVIALLLISIFLVGCTQNQEIKAGSPAEQKSSQQAQQPAPQPPQNTTPNDGLDAALQDLDTAS